MDHGPQLCHLWYASLVIGWLIQPISELWPQCKHETDAQTFTGVSCVQSTFLRYLHNRKMKDLNDGNKGQPRPCVLNMHQAVLMSMHHHVS